MKIKSSRKEAIAVTVLAGLLVLITSSCDSDTTQSGGNNGTSESLDVTTIREASFETIRTEFIDGDIIYQRIPAPAALKDGMNLVMADQDQGFKYAPFSDDNLTDPKHCHERYFTGGTANTGGVTDASAIDNLEYRKVSIFQFTLTSADIDSSCIYLHPTEGWEYTLQAITYTFSVQTLDPGGPFTVIDGTYSTQLNAYRLDTESFEAIQSAPDYGNGTFTLSLP